MSTLQEKWLNVILNNTPASKYVTDVEYWLEYYVHMPVIFQDRRKFSDWHSATDFKFEVA